MIGSLIGAFLGILIAFYSDQTRPISENIFLLVGLTGIIFITVVPFLYIFTLNSLQRAEVETSPYVTNLYNKDYQFSGILIFFGIFGILSLGVIFGIFYLNLNPWIGIGIWIFLLGIASDLIHHFIKHYLKFLDPFSLVKKLSSWAKSAVRNENEDSLLQSVDALTEIGAKSLRNHRTVLASEVITEFPQMIQTFLKSNKSVSHVSQDEEIKKRTGLDEVSFTLFYFLERIEYIFQVALEKGLELTCSQMISSLGKIIFYCADFDFSLTTAPLHLFSKCTKKAQEKGFDEVAIRSSLTLVEVAKSMLYNLDIKYAELQPTYLTIIDILNGTAQETFKRDKQVNITVLTQPFRDIEEAFKSDKMSNHQDTPFILQALKKVQEEWETVQVILQTMPPVSEITNPIFSGPQNRKEDQPESSSSLSQPDG